MAGVIVLVIYVIHATNDATKWVTHTHQVETSLISVRADILEAQSDARQFALTRNPEMQTVYQAAAARCHADLDAVEHLVQDNPKQLANLGELRKATESKFQFLQDLMNIAMHGTADEGTHNAVKLLATNQGVRLMAHFNAIEKEMLDVERALLAKRNSDLQRNRTFTYVGAGLLTSCSFVLFMMLLNTTRQSALTEERERVRIEQLNSRLQEEVVGHERAEAQLEVTVKQLNETNDALERAAKAKDVFLSSMSHELRTPLNSILGFVGTLLMRLPGQLTDEQERQLKIVQMSSRHLLSLINDILDLAKLESGAITLSFEKFDLHELIESVCTQLRPLAEQKRLVLTCKLSADPIFVRTDERATTQILINLINNAIKFTDRGSVTVSTRVLHDKVAIDVIDTGIGIPADKQALLFQPFQQISATARQEGTGLGLHLSRKLLQLMNGSIELESEVRKGSRFTVFLNLENQQDAESSGAEKGTKDGSLPSS